MSFTLFQFNNIWCVRMSPIKFKHKLLMKYMCLQERKYLFLEFATLETKSGQIQLGKTPIVTK